MRCRAIEPFSFHQVFLSHRLLLCDVLSLVATTTIQFYMQMAFMYILRTPYRHRVLFSTIAGTVITTAKVPVQSRLAFSKIAGGLGSLFIGAGIIQYATDEGTRRQVSFWSVAFPIYLHYRFVQWQMKYKSDEESEAEFNKLHDRYTGVAKDLVFRMRGFYLKTAQMASTMDSFIPPQYLEWCRKTQDEVPTELDPGEAKRMVERSLGKKLSEIFSEFDEDPCGAASIGQVHRAQLKDGKKVAVKVQAQDIERKFRADIKTIKDFVALAMPQHVAPMEEVEKQFVTEFDYVAEAKNLEEIHQNITPVFGDKVVIPRPVLPLCTKEVLVMDFLEGKSLLKGVKEFFTEYAESQGKTYDEIQEEQLELIRSGKFEFKDIDEESHRMKYYQTLENLRAYTLNTFRAIYNWSFGFVVQSLQYAKPKHILNLGEIIKTVSIVHGYEIMVDGAFNGDPHPGNIMLLDDGRLGLIDYGQVKHIEKNSRVAYAKLIRALANDDKTSVVQILRSMGSSTKYQRDDILYLLAKFWHDNNSKEITGDMNPQAFVDWCEAQDPMRTVPADIVMAGRVSFLLRAIGNAFGIDLHMAKLWLPIADRVLEDSETSKQNNVKERMEEHFYEKVSSVRSSIPI